MPALVHTDWQYRGIEAVTLENASCRVDILSGLGAKIYNLIDLATGVNLLWHNPRQAPVAAPFGSNFDNLWSGGWDEPFPNGGEDAFNGDVQPFLGELWTKPWHSEVVRDGKGTGVHLWCEGVITPARVEKWLFLDPERPILHEHHRIQNIGTEPFDFMFGVHPALSVSPRHRIDIPARWVEVAESRDGKLGEPGSTHEWPYVTASDGTRVDLRSVMPETALTYGLLYAHGLDDGWIAVSAPDGGPGFGLAFPKEVLSSVWLWLVYGGWRGFHHIAVEPWTSHPTLIHEAKALGRTLQVAPGQPLEFDLTAVVYRGLRTVDCVTMDGSVSGV